MKPKATKYERFTEGFEWTHRLFCTCGGRLEEASHHSNGLHICIECGKKWSDKAFAALLPWNMKGVFRVHHGIETPRFYKKIYKACK